VTGRPNIGHAISGATVAITRPGHPPTTGTLIRLPKHPAACKAKVRIRCAAGTAYIRVPADCLTVLPDNQRASHLTTSAHGRTVTHTVTKEGDTP
jgi:hypothetical protein